jgi:hypothetical protein
MNTTPNESAAVTAEQANAAMKIIDTREFWDDWNVKEAATTLHRFIATHSQPKADERPLGGGVEVPPLRKVSADAINPQLEGIAADGWNACRDMVIHLNARSPGVVSDGAELLAYLREAQKAYSGDHASGTFRRAAEKLERMLSAAPAASVRKPDGYAYRYPWGHDGTVIRHNNGEEVNGAKPIEAIPYYYGAPAAPGVAAQDADAGAVEDYPQLLRKLADALYANEPSRQTQSSLARGAAGRIERLERDVRQLRAVCEAAGITDIKPACRSPGHDDDTPPNAPPAAVETPAADGVGSKEWSATMARLELDAINDGVDPTIGAGAHLAQPPAAVGVDEAAKTVRELRDLLRHAQAKSNYTFLRDEMRGIFDYFDSLAAAGVPALSAKVAELESELAQTQSALDANWITHQRVVAAEKRAESAEQRAAEAEAENAALRNRAAQHDTDLAELFESLSGAMRGLADGEPVDDEDRQLAGDLADMLDAKIAEIRAAISAGREAK